MKICVIRGSNLPGMLRTWYGGILNKVLNLLLWFRLLAVDGVLIFFSIWKADSSFGHFLSAEVLGPAELFDCRRGVGSYHRV